MTGVFFYYDSGLDYCHNNYKTNNKHLLEHTIKLTATDYEIDKTQRP